MTEDNEIVLTALKYLRDEHDDAIDQCFPWSDGLSPLGRIRLARLNAEIARRIPQWWAS